MTKIVRTVSRSIWRLSPIIKHRHKRLLDGLYPDELISKVGSESLEVARSGGLVLNWEESKERAGYYRLRSQVRLGEDTFDQLFNGRCGYRAQYYLSPEEGVIFNREIIRALSDAVHVAYKIAQPDYDLQILDYSLFAPHSKIWIHKDTAAFNDADSEMLNPLRWVENRAGQGRKAPLPAHLEIDLKGTFIHPKTKELFIDDFKLNRSCDIFEKGYS